MGKQVNKAKPALFGKTFFDPVQCFHRRQALRNRTIGFASFLNGGKEFAINQFDPVVGHSDIRQINRIFIAIHKVIIAGDIGAVIANITKERPEGARRY